MRILPGVIVPNQPCMRAAMKAVEHIYREFGRAEGFTMTAGMESYNIAQARTVTHGAGSWHPVGAAFDCRTRYFDAETAKKVYRAVRERLPEYDVILHNTHLHVEVGDELAKQWGLML